MDKRAVCNKVIRAFLADLLGAKGKVEPNLLPSPTRSVESTHRRTKLTSPYSTSRKGVKKPKSSQTEPKKEAQETQAEWRARVAAAVSIAASDYMVRRLPIFVGSTSHRLSYIQTNLLSNNPDYRPRPRTINDRAVDAWGITLLGSTLVAVFRDFSRLFEFRPSTGRIVREIEVVPGFPTGLVAAKRNTGFRVEGRRAELIIVGSALFTSSSNISAWSSHLNDPSVAPPVAGPFEGDLFTGVTILGTGKRERLYVSNFSVGTIVVFDTKYRRVDEFRIPGVSPRLHPYNVKAIGSRLYVTFAGFTVIDESVIPVPGTGLLGVIRNPDRSTRKFTSLVVDSSLNIPYGMTRLPRSAVFDNGTRGKPTCKDKSTSERCGKHIASETTVLLVGNQGDGAINVFERKCGQWLGPLLRCGRRGCRPVPVQIDGLRGLEATRDPTPIIFFAAGPENRDAPFGQDGLAGRLDLVRC